jgi:nicotinamidase-related amidase
MVIAGSLAAHCAPSRPHRRLATDSCVDSTIRSAISNDYDVVVVADGHTVSDRPHMDAAAVIRHHHCVWSQLITNRFVRIVDESKASEDLG